MFRVLFNPNVNEEVSEESMFGFKKKDLELEMEIIRNMTGPSIRILKSADIHEVG